VTLDHQHGVTNVWTYPPLNRSERFRGTGKRSAPRVHNPGKSATLHLNQKPLEFMRRIITACTRLGDVVWEPFGGLCSASVAAVEMGRDAYAAEIVTDFRGKAAERLMEAKEVNEHSSQGQAVDGPIEQELRAVEAAK